MIVCPTCNQKLTCHTCRYVGIKTKVYKNPAKGSKTSIICRKRKQHIVMSQYIEIPGTTMFVDVGCYEHSAWERFRKEEAQP